MFGLIHLTSQSSSKCSHLFEVAHQTTDSIHQWQSKPSETLTILCFLDLAASTSLVFLQLILYFMYHVIQDIQAGCITAWEVEGDWISKTIIPLLLRWYLCSLFSFHWEKHRQNTFTFQLLLYSSQLIFASMNQGKTDLSPWTIMDNQR